MRPNWPKLSSLAQKTSTLDSFKSLVQSLLPKDNLLWNILNFTTAGDWDCVVTVKSLHSLHHSVDFIF